MNKYLICIIFINRNRYVITLENNVFSLYVLLKEFINLLQFIFKTNIYIKIKVFILNFMV
jgi:hypothetical protein